MLRLACTLPLAYQTNHGYSYPCSYPPSSHLSSHWVRPLQPSTAPTHCLTASYPLQHFYNTLQHSTVYSSTAFLQSTTSTTPLCVGDAACKEACSCVDGTHGGRVGLVRSPQVSPGATIWPENWLVARGRAEQRGIRPSGSEMSIDETVAEATS